MFVSTHYLVSIYGYLIFPFYLSIHLHVLTIGYQYQYFILFKPERRIIRCKTVNFNSFYQNLVLHALKNVKICT